jgi:hypothetical protein
MPCDVTASTDGRWQKPPWQGNIAAHDRHRAPGIRLYTRTREQRKVATAVGTTWPSAAASSAPAATILGRCDAQACSRFADEPTTTHGSPWHQYRDNIAGDGGTVAVEQRAPCAILQLRSSSCCCVNFVFCSGGRRGMTLQIGFNCRRDSRPSSLLTLSHISRTTQGTLVSFAARGSHSAHENWWAGVSPPSYVEDSDRHTTASWTSCAPKVPMIRTFFLQKLNCECYCCPGSYCELPTA